MPHNFYIDSDDGPVRLVRYSDIISFEGDVSERVAVPVAQVPALIAELKRLST